MEKSDYVWVCDPVDGTAMYARHIPVAVFSLALVYKEMDLSISEGKEYVRKKLERDYNKLIPRTREILEDRYRNIIDVLFVN